MIKITNTNIDGLVIIEPVVHSDSRGYFFESYKEEDFKSNGLHYSFIQDNESQSSKGVLRGLHYQKTYQQAKLVRVISGKVFDVAVDLRKGSCTYGHWFGIVLSGRNKKQFLIPRGFAHGFFVLSKTAVFAYKVDNSYVPADEAGIMWNDPNINIKWPIPNNITIILSEKDKKHPQLSIMRPEL